MEIIYHLLAHGGLDLELHSKHTTDPTLSSKQVKMRFRIVCVASTCLYDPPYNAWACS